MAMSYSEEQKSKEQSPMDTQKATILVQRMQTRNNLPRDSSPFFLCGNLPLRDVSCVFSPDHSRCLATTSNKKPFLLYENAFEPFSRATTVSFVACLDLVTESLRTLSLPCACVETPHGENFVFSDLLQVSLFNNKKQSAFVCPLALEHARFSRAVMLFSCLVCPPLMHFFVFCYPCPNLSNSLSLSSRDKPIFSTQSFYCT